MVKNGKNLAGDDLFVDKDTDTTGKKTVANMLYALSENHPFLIEMDPPVHVKDLVWEVVNDIRRRHKANTVTLADLKSQIRERRLYAGVTV